MSMRARSPNLAHASTIASAALECLAPERVPAQSGGSLQVRVGSATISLLGERHMVRPRGGGGNGATARHTVLRTTEEGTTMQTLPAKTTLELHVGDTLSVQTAGGDPADGIGTAR
jgi:hypothetical protein